MPECNWDDCEECADGECVDTCTRDPNLCLECNGEGWCVNRCTRDPNLCLMCDGQGNCVSRCDPNLCQDCNEGTCEVTCDPDECCDEGMCVDKCDPDGAPCEHDEPVIQAGCQWQSPDDHRCFPDQLGKTCMWHLQYEYEYTAKCADCAPGCGKVYQGYCAFWKAETCRNAWFIGCVCDYDGDEDQRPKVGDGARYTCE